METRREPEIEVYIRAIGELPDRIFRNYRRTFGTFNEQCLVKAFRKRYKAKAQWLSWLHEPMGEPHPDLVFTGKVQYKVDAELSFATLNIAKEICLRVPKPGGIDSAADWWWKCEVEGCDNALKGIGLIGPPAITGKREWTDFSIRFLDRVDPTKEEYSLSSLSWGSEKETINMTPRIALSNYMTKLAVEDRYFRNSYYQDYIRKERRYVYAVRNGGWQAAFLLPNDELLILDKHSKVPKDCQQHRDPMPELPRKGEKGFVRKNRR